MLAAPPSLNPADFWLPGLNLEPTEIRYYFFKTFIHHALKFLQTYLDSRMHRNIDEGFQKKERTTENVLKRPILCHRHHDKIKTDPSQLRTQ